MTVSKAAREKCTKLSYEAVAKGAAINTQFPEGLVEWSEGAFRAKSIGPCSAFAQFVQDVSEAMTDVRPWLPAGKLQTLADRFILPDDPDPLAEAWEAAWDKARDALEGIYLDDRPQAIGLATLRAELEARGLLKGDDDG